MDPATRCRRVDFNESPPSSRLQLYTDPTTNQQNTFVGGGVVARCIGVNSTLRADSAEYYEANGFLVLIDNVAYDEPRRVRMTSMRLTYFVNDERLVADGNVVVTLPSGTTMTGPNVEYLRAVPAVRPASRVTAIGRPTLRLVEAPRPATDTAPARGADTTTVIANTIVNDADSLVYASGAVEITRTDVVASSDSATLDQGTETARLLRNALIRGRRGRPFTLSGVAVDLFSRQRTLTRVLAKDSARIVSEDLNLRSDTVDLRLDEGQVERAFAWGPSRAVATSPDREVVADSIQADMPGQRIRELRALRRAVAESSPDSTRIRSTERDVLRGDTIVARFDTTLAPQDTTRNPPVRQIVSSGNASALYQIASSEGREARPGINYVRGRIITVEFDSNQVQTVTVIDSATGVYLEPADSTADTTATRAPRRTPTAQPRSPQSASSALRAPAPRRAPTSSAALAPLAATGGRPTLHREGVR